MNYDNKQIIQLLNSDVITAILKIYNLTYQHIGVRLNMSRQAINYKMRTDSWRDHEKSTVYDLFKQNGCEDGFIILLHTMTKQQKKVAK